MATKIRIRAKLEGDITEVKTLMSHPMETGLRKDSSGNKIPEHFIKEVTIDHNGKNLLTADWGIAISKNPYLSFTFKGGAPGDTITVSWTDNKGETAKEEAKIS